MGTGVLGKALPYVLPSTERLCPLASTPGYIGVVVRRPKVGRKAFCRLRKCCLGRVKLPDIAQRRPDPDMAHRCIRKFLVYQLPAAQALARISSASRDLRVQHSAPKIGRKALHRFVENALGFSYPAEFHQTPAMPTKPSGRSGNCREMIC